MAAPFDPAELPRHLATYGPRATIITVSDTARPHVGTSMVELDGERLIIDVGPRAAGHLRHNPELCLTWTPPAGEGYQLIVDGTAVDIVERGDSFRVAVALRAGIRHRAAGTPDGPNCIPLGMQATGRGAN